MRVDKFYLNFNPNYNSKKSIFCFRYRKIKINKEFCKAYLLLLKDNYIIQYFISLLKILKKQL